MDYLCHHGIMGQKWGKRNGPPYPLSGGDYTKAEKEAIYKKRRDRNSIYNKKHFDEVLNKDKTTLSTLSYDKDRLKGADYFYATHTKLDKHQYNAMFNRPIEKDVYDENGNNIGKSRCLKYKINNNIKNDLKVASEDSASKVFMDMYKNDRDFYNFVTDEKRMRDYFVEDKYKFKGYRETRDVLQKIDSGKKPTEEELKKVYRMFNYVIPYDGEGDKRKYQDVYNQRTKFFDKMKKEGYGAVLDTNDAIYGGFKAESPVIVFDMGQIVPADIKETTVNSKRVSSLVTVGRKALGI